MNDLLKAAIDKLSLMDTKITIIGSGGGIGISRLLTIPGASRAIHQIIFPHSMDSWHDYLPLNVDLTDISFLSERFLRLIDRHGNTLVFSAALSTSRDRKGLNKCVALRNGQFHELVLPKGNFTESFEEQLKIRQEQDEEVTKWLLGLL